MSHPPQQNYQQYAMRPGPPAQGYGPPPVGGGYDHGRPDQDPQRYYTPGPQAPGGKIYTNATSNEVLRRETNNSVDHGSYPNFQPPTQGTPGPYYVASSEGLAQHAQQQAQHPNQSSHIPPNGAHAASADVSPPTHTYVPYSQPPQGPPQDPYAQQQRQSTYGAQELATSVYDSPIAPHNPAPTGNYPSSLYSEDGHVDNVGGAPPAPYTHHPQGNPQYQSYHPPPDHAPPPMPSGQAPPPPSGEIMTPPPLQPAGAAYEARHGQPNQGAQGPPQYKPYVPPGADGASAPPPPSDYYQQSGVY